DGSSVISDLNSSITKEKVEKVNKLVNQVMEANYDPVEYIRLLNEEDFHIIQPEQFDYGKKLLSEGCFSPEFVFDNDGNMIVYIAGFLNKNPTLNVYNDKYDLVGKIKIDSLRSFPNYESTFKKYLNNL